MKVEENILEVVNRLIKEGVPTTIATVAEQVNKTPQYVHQVLKTSKLLKKVTVEGHVEVFPIEAPQQTGIPYVKEVTPEVAIPEKVQEETQAEEPEYDTDGELTAPFDDDDENDPFNL